MLGSFYAGFQAFSQRVAPLMTVPEYQLVNQHRAQGIPLRRNKLLRRHSVVPVEDRLEVLLEGLLIAVKIIGHGALKGLAGLRAMNPQESFSQNINETGRRNAEYFAVAANYEPTDPGLRGLLSRGMDAVVDRIFEVAENDLVVPEAGVYGDNGSDGFSIPPDHRLRIPGDMGVTHTGMFRHADVAQRLNTWLQ